VKVAANSLGEAAVVWARDGASDAASAVQAVYRNRQGAWSSPVDIGAVCADAADDLEIVIDDNGVAVAMWVGPTGALHAATRAASGSWVDRTVSTPATNVSDASLAIDGRGNAVGVWVGGPNTVVRAVIRPGASGTWQPPIDVSPAGSSSPTVAFGADGRSVAIWNRVAGQQATVASAELDGKGPVLDRLVAPMRPIAVGTNARFSIRVTPWAAALAGSARWRFGDSASARGTDVSHRYGRVGRYMVTFSQPDARGDISTVTTVVRVIAFVRSVRRPSIAGIPAIGATLTCRRGTWTGSPPISFRYRWTRNGSPISDARARMRRLVRRDAGSRIACVVIAANPVGSVRAVSRPVAVER